MNDLEQEILRKIRIRQETLDNLGLESGDPPGGAPGKTNLSRSRKLLAQMLEEMEPYKSLTGYHPIQSERRGIGRAVVLTRKALRKVLHLVYGFYIFSILKQQNQFNEGVYQALEGVLPKALAEIEQQRRAIDALQEEVRKLRERESL